jgi:hypothetical protein
VLLPRLDVGVLVGGGLVELLALRLGESVAVALKEPQVGSGSYPERSLHTGGPLCSWTRTAR